MRRISSLLVCFQLVLSYLAVMLIGPANGEENQPTHLDSLLTPAEKQFLMSELARVDPPERLRALAVYGQQQLELGGGFYGILPDQLVDPDSIPLPADATGRLKAALCLANQREINLAALREVNPDYVIEFAGESLPDFLDRVASRGATPSQPVEKLSLELDSSALEGFFDALSDGEITMDEAEALAALPSNQAMLEHRRNLGYIPAPLPDTESLAKMIRMAGSSDPLDRLWCWINPQNAFGYSDLAQNAENYSRFLAEIHKHRRRLQTAVLTQIASYTPAGVELEARFAFTVGWAIRGWTTPEMAGLNVEQVKDDWDLLFGTLVEETYHRLQLKICRTTSGMAPREFSDLVTAETGNARYDRLYEIVSYTVLEGSANLVRGRFAAAALEEKAPEGAELLARFVEQVVGEGDLEGADALIAEGLRGNGPLYGLGWKLASVIAEKEGKRAIGEYQKSGPVQFFLQGARFSALDDEPLVGPDVIAALGTLDSLLTR